MIFFWRANRTVTLTEERRMLRNNQVWTCCEAQRIIHACHGPVSMPLCGKRLSSRSVVATSQQRITCPECQRLLTKAQRPTTN